MWYCSELSIVEESDGFLQILSVYALYEHLSVAVVRESS